MSRPGAILCPNCRKLVNADEERCPHCGISHPGAAWRRYFTGVLGRLDADNAFTYLLYLNGGMFVLSLLLSPRQIGMAPNPFGFFSPHGEALLLLGGTGSWALDPTSLWRMLSANYLHGSLLHIFFNMAALRTLAPTVLREYGLQRAVIIYTLGGIAGFLVSSLSGTRLTIGASAALCSLIGSLLYYGKSRGGSYGQAVFQTVWGWTIGIVLFGFLIRGIDNWAHGGGLAAGFLLGMVLGYQERGRTTSTHRLLATVCMVATLAALGWGVFTGLAYRLLT